MTDDRPHLRVFKIARDLISGTLAGPRAQSPHQNIGARSRARRSVAMDACRSSAAHAPLHHTCGIINGLVGAACATCRICRHGAERVQDRLASESRFFTQCRDLQPAHRMGCRAAGEYTRALGRRTSPVDDVRLGGATGASSSAGAKSPGTLLERCGMKLKWRCRIRWVNGGRARWSATAQRRHPAG
jgi:hypothetical protein